MELSVRLVVVVVGVAAGLFFGWRLAGRIRRTARVNVYRRGDRPDKVLLDVEGIVYDLTEYGVRRETLARTIWTYEVPEAAARLGSGGRFTVGVLPPFTDVEVVIATGGCNIDVQLDEV